MVLHFNLKGVFLFCLGLICWQLLLPCPLLGATIGLAAFSICRRRDFSVADGVFSAAFLLNVWYITASWGNIRQYDYYNFVMHADYFLQNGFFLAAPKDYLQTVYFQPPLWGFIVAAVTKYGMFFGVAQEESIDCVRYLNLFFVSGAGIIFWRLMETFGFKRGVCLGLFALFCFFPAHAILANLVNNDAAVYFLMTAMVYIGYQWYLSGAWKETFMLAVLLFVAGMVKFSGLMIVPALGVLGLCRLAQAEHKLSLRMWAQFGIIVLGALLGFGWGWFLLYYGLPLVPPPLDAGFQAMTGYTLSERIFSLQSAFVPYADVRAGISEPNVFLALVKTALFGEWSWRGLFWAYIMYILGAMLSVLLVMTFFSLWKYKLGRGYAFNMFAIVFVFSVLGAWVNFWLDYPYFCSTEFRYAVILLPLSLLWFGNYLTQKSLPKAVYRALAGGLILFVTARIMLYQHTI